MAGNFDIAQVCLNGHVITDSFSTEYKKAQPYCDMCGEETIVKCTNCETPIRGYDSGSSVIYTYEPPSYCYKCGHAFPWISSKLKYAEELAEHFEMNEDDKRLLIENLEDLMRDTPRKQIAALKVKKVLAKTEPIFVSALKEVFKAVSTEPIVKSLWG